MSLQTLPASAFQTGSLIKQLETTTFETSYTNKYLSKEPKTFGEKIKQWWAKVWLHGLGRNGWKAGDGVIGIPSIEKERECIANYTSKLTDLITHLAKTPIMEIKYARIMGVLPEPGTSPSDRLNERRRASDELEDKIHAFYKALKERVEQLTGTDGDSIEKQAPFYQAGLKIVSDKIEEHNLANRKKPYINPNWSKVVDFEVAETMRHTLAEQITVEAAAIKGPQAIAGPVDSYFRIFESNPTLQECGVIKPKKVIVASVLQQILDTRRDEFLARKKQQRKESFDLDPDVILQTEELMKRRQVIQASLPENQEQLEEIDSQLKEIYDNAREEHVKKSVFLDFFSPQEGYEKIDDDELFNLVYPEPRPYNETDLMRQLKENEQEIDRLVEAQVSDSEEPDTL